MRSRLRGQEHTGNIARWMKILLDESVPQKLRLIIEGGHTVVTAWYQGWSGLKNGALLNAAEKAGFDLFITADQELSYQQNLTGRKMALVVLSTNNWPSSGHISPASWLRWKRPHRAAIPRWTFRRKSSPRRVSLPGFAAPEISWVVEGYGFFRSGGRRAINGLTKSVHESVAENQ